MSFLLRANWLTGKMATSLFIVSLFSLEEIALRSSRDDANEAHTHGSFLNQHGGRIEWWITHWREDHKYQV